MLIEAFEDRILACEEWAPCLMEVGHDGYFKEMLVTSNHWNTLGQTFMLLLYT